MKPKTKNNDTPSAAAHAQRPPARYNSKYHAVRIGHHASIREHIRARQLQLLQQQGLITQLKEQVTFELIPAQRDPHGHLIERAVRYVADYVYYDRDGNFVVEDVKGVHTPQYIIKRKLMLYVHGIRISET